MAEDYVSRLILETRGAEAVKDMRVAIATTDAALRQLVDDWAKGTITTEEYRKEADRLNVTLNQQKMAVDLLERSQERANAETEQATGATVKLSAGAKRSQQAIQEMSRGLEDIFVTGNLTGGINNVNRLFEILSGSLGLTSPQLLGISLAVTAVGIAGTALINHWSEWFPTTKIKEFSDKIDELKDKIKTIEDKEHKLTIDTSDLNVAREELEKLTAARAAYKALQEERPEEQKVVAEQVTKTITEFGGPDKLLGQMKFLRQQEGTFATEAEKGQVSAIEQQIKAADEKLKKATNQSVRGAVIVEREKLQTRLGKVFADIQLAGDERIRNEIAMASKVEEAPRAELERLSVGIGGQFAAGMKESRPALFTKEAKEAKKKEQEATKAEYEARAKAQKELDDQTYEDAMADLKEADRKKKEVDKAGDTIAEKRDKERKDKQTLQVEQAAKTGATLAARKQETEKVLAPVLPEIEKFMLERHELAEEYGMVGPARTRYDKETQAEVARFTKDYLMRSGFKGQQTPETIAGAAAGVAEQDFSQQVVAAQGTTLNNQSATNAVIANILAVVAAQQAKAQQQTQELDQLNGQARQLRTNTTTPLNRGSN